MQVRDTDRDWNEMAKADAYYAVLSAPRFSHADKNPEALKEFFDSGTGWIERIFATIREKLSPNFAPEVGLDFGCGVGRLMLPMARHCRKVIGIDVAEQMLTIARQNLTHAGVNDFELFSGVEQLQNSSDLTLDWINSYIVFQHIPPSKAMPLLHGMLSKLKIGGVISLHITFAKDDRMLEWSTRKVYIFQMREQAMRVMVEKNPDDSAVQSMYDHDLNEIIMTFFRYGIVRLYLTHEDHGGQHGAIIYGMKMG